MRTSDRDKALLGRCRIGAHEAVLEREYLALVDALCAPAVRGPGYLGEFRSSFVRLLQHPSQTLAVRAARILYHLFMARLQRRASLKKAIRIISASGLFDAEYYRLTNADVARSGVDPLTHYLIYGAAEGRRPSVRFDPAYYSAAATKIRKSHLNPLLHYLLIGKHRGLPPRKENAAPLIRAPSREQWDRLARRFVRKPPAVNVVIPTYGGGDVTLNCLYRVLSAPVRTPYAVTVIDDAGPDRKLSSELRALAERGLIDLLVNDTNLGFPASANRGILHRPGLDVVVLNSDTEVYGDWIDRLRACAASQPDIGTVTPLTNCGTICSYPAVNQDNDGFLEIDYAELDHLTSRINAGGVVDLPTGVGFCLYLAAACLRDVGLFDDETFGRGYGEENDLCRRAAKRGWRSVAACDVFVRHLGRMSFRGDSERQALRAQRILVKRHPDYEGIVSGHIRRNPLRPYRARLDAARLARALNRPTFLFVSHRIGGGTERHVLEMRRALKAAGVRTLIVRPRASSERSILIEHDAAIATPNLDGLDIVVDRDLILELLRLFRPLHIHVHHLFGYHASATEFVGMLAERLRIGYDFTVHDYFAICPRINLVDDTGIYCHDPEVTACERCIADGGSFAGEISARRWRTRYETFLRGARRVFAPSAETANRIMRQIPGLVVTVRPHFDPPRARPARRRRHREGPRTVAVIGAINQGKGSLVLASCCRDIELRKLPLRYVLFGYSDMDLSEFEAIRVTGPYAEHRLPKMLADARCDLAFFPAVWPETYSYTLSEAFLAGLYPVAFDVGAIAERIRSARWGTLLPLDAAKDPARVNDALLSMPIPEEAPPMFSDGAQPRSIDISAYYQLPTLDLLLRGGRKRIRPPAQRCGAAEKGTE